MTGWAARARTATSRRPARGIADDLARLVAVDRQLEHGPGRHERPARPGRRPPSRRTSARSSSRRWTYARTAPIGTSDDILSVPATTGSR